MALQSTDDLADELVTRGDALDVIAETGPVPASDLAAEVGTSVSTVNRVVSTFVNEGALERTDEGIVLTPYGEVLVRETDRFIRWVGTARTLQPILDSLTHTPVAFELDWFVDATVTEATPKNPYAPLARYTELFSDSKRKYLVGDQFVVPEQGVDAACEAIDDSVVCTCVWSEPALERMADQYPSLVEWSAGRENLTALVAESVPFDFALLDDRLLVYGFDDELGIMSVIADTDDADAIEWGRTVFESVHEDAEMLDLTAPES